MKPNMQVEYAILIKGKTRLESLIERFNTRSQAKFYIEAQGGRFEDYAQEHDIFHRALDTLQTKLSKEIKYKIVDRDFVPSFLFSPKHVVIVIGQDGLVANTAKYARGIPIIAVNPDPERHDGVLLPFEVSNAIAGLQQVLANTYQAQTARFAEAKLNDGQKLLAFNDLFIGAASHTSARYKITFGEQLEEHSSSGVIVSTQAGATGWMSSIFNMAWGVSSLFGGKTIVQQPSINTDQLLFAVREPFASIRTQVGITAGLIRPPHQLTIESYMPSHGVIFSDGIEKDFLAFNSGAIATIGLAAEEAWLVRKKE